jgi:hypothetical protein
LTVDTVLWANGLDSEKTPIKEGQTLKIPPVDGVIHKVKKGETVYSIAKRYESNPQAMVDYPFNVFTNDETFALAVGQTLMVPDGIMPKVKPISPQTSLAASLTPDAGVVRRWEVLCGRLRVGFPRVTGFTTRLSISPIGVAGRFWRPMRDGWW